MPHDWGISTSSADVISQNGIEIKAFWIESYPAWPCGFCRLYAVHNHSDRQDKLIAVRTDFAGKNEVHEMKLENDVMKMRPVKMVLSFQRNHLLPLSLAAII